MCEAVKDQDHSGYVLAGFQVHLNRPRLRHLMTGYSVILPSLILGVPETSF